MLRYHALKKITTNKINTNGLSQQTEKKISKIFGQYVFNFIAIKKYVPKKSHAALLEATKKDTAVDFKTIKDMAQGMKHWALEQGATHYTHWFQPLTYATAEKHDTFFKPSQDTNTQGIETLSETDLVRKETDASSFPTGGLRETHHARGYTIWDPTSFAFILATENAKTLYIPSIFIAYTGEALDFKTPLLKAKTLIDKAATAVCRYFNPNIKQVHPTLGWEQEYFIVDANLYNIRPDLMLTGRTLFGHASARGQQLEDHYFASIPDRIQAYMKDFEDEALKLGIPISTRHNEVAPGQYECAPFYEEINLALDHNLLIMALMHRVARKHGLRVLLHEKPFAGLNGSGKHNNWSLATDTGKNLLSPGKHAGNNLQFLAFFINIIKAIDNHEALLRASITGPGNDHRLGANEAPPSIISVFTGSYMEDVLKRFKKIGLFENEQKDPTFLQLALPQIPSIKIDNTDRNRTSPFPFTGNRFEFRAVGASTNCAATMTVLNTIVADQLMTFKKEVDALVGKQKIATQEAMVTTLQQYIRKSERIIFNGDSYTQAWEEEASQRGLSNLKFTPYALNAFITKSSLALFEKHEVLNKKELQARHQVLLEYYAHKIEIEALVIKDLTHTHVLSATYRYLEKLTGLAKNLDALAPKQSYNTIKAEIEAILTLVNAIKNQLTKLEKELPKAKAEKDAQKIAMAFCDKVKPIGDQVRIIADKLEGLIDDRYWPFPKYRELLYLV